MELLPQEHVFKPESPLIAQVLITKSAFKVQRWVAWVMSQMTFATTILQNPVTMQSCDSGIVQIEVTVRSYRFTSPSELGRVWASPTPMCYQRWAVDLNGWTMCLDSLHECFLPLAPFSVPCARCHSVWWCTNTASVVRRIRHVLFRTRDACGMNEHACRDIECRSVVLYVIVLLPNATQVTNIRRGAS